MRSRKNTEQMSEIFEVSSPEFLAHHVFRGDAYSQGRPSDTSSRGTDFSINASYATQPPESPEIPKDRFRVVLITSFLFGIGATLPFHFYLTVTEYWKYKFRDVTNNASINSTESTHMQNFFSSYLNIAASICFVLFNVVNSSITHRVSPTYRIAIPLIAAVILILITGSFVFINTDEYQQDFLGIAISLGALLNGAGAFVNGGSMGICGCLPTQYIRSQVIGQSLAGVIASAASIMSLVIDSDPLSSALIYFLTGVAALLIVFGFFMATLRSDFYRFYISTQAGRYRTTSEESAKDQIPYFLLFKKMWPLVIAVVAIGWVSFSVFPAVMIRVQPITIIPDSPFTGRLFLPLFCFLVFNLSDVAGKLVAVRLPLPSKYALVTLGLSVARVVLIPLFMLCNAQPREHLPVVFNNDAWFAVFASLLGLSNGYLLTVGLAAAPKMVPVQHQEAAGGMMGSFLGLGLLGGSSTSYLLLLLL